jgi:hypothetical protein
MDDVERAELKPDRLSRGDDERLVADEAAARGDPVSGVGERPLPFRSDNVDGQGRPLLRGDGVDLVLSRVGEGEEEGDDAREQERVRPLESVVLVPAGGGSRAAGSG